MADTNWFDIVGYAWQENLGLAERESICALGALHASVAQKTWLSLSATEVQHVAVGFRRAVDLGAICAQCLINEDLMARLRLASRR